LDSMVLDDGLSNAYKNRKFKILPVPRFLVSVMGALLSEKRCTGKL